MRMASAGAVRRGAIVAFVAGCAAALAHDRAAGAPAAQAVAVPPSIEYAAPRILEARDTVAKGAVRLIVRAAAPGEIDSRTSDEIRRGLGAGATIGVIALAEAAVLPFTMFSPGALLGGIVVTIGSAALLSAERAVQERIVRAVQESDFAARLRSAFEARIETAHPEAAAAWTLEVVMLAYGVVEDPPRGTYCVFADVEIVLRDGADERYRDRVLILPARRSPDAPVPDCRLRGTLADSEGTAIRSAFEDYARAMPAILARRLPGLPWRN